MSFDFKEYYPKSEHSRTGSISLGHPLFIGDFSLDQQGEICFDKSGLQRIKQEYLSDRKIKFDLNEGMDNVIRKDSSKPNEEKLDRLLQWIIENKNKFEKPQNTKLNSLSIDFICFRGLLTKILCTPYEEKEEWIIHAQKFHGTIYLLAKETQEEAKRRSEETDNDRKESSWGYKFEQFMTNDDTSIPVNENEGYCCILRSRLNTHSLVYGAEVDGIDEKKYQSDHSNLNAFIELKTTKEIQDGNDYWFKRSKLRKWFLQSHLVGVPQLICGFKDQDVIVKRLESFSVEEMPNIAQVFWSKELMFSFLDNLLSWIKRNVTEENIDFVYEIRRPPYSTQIECTSLGINPELAFLSEEYMNNIFM